MSEPLVYLQGRLLPQSAAHVTLHDAGFVLGATVTDLCRTFRQRLYRWDDHLARFRASCRLTGIAVDADDALLTERACELVRHNAGLLAVHDELALVVFATPGPIGYYLGEPGGLGDGAGTVGMHTFPLPLARYRPLFTRGAHLAIPATRHVGASSIDRRIKHRSRMHWWLAEREVRSSHPAAQAILLDEAGHVTETASSNFAIVKDGVVITPPAASVLPGVSLHVLRELGETLAIPFQERPVAVADCLAADEAMLTCTTYCLAGVSRFQDASLPWPGPTFQRLLAAWSEEVGVDIAGQIAAGG